MNNQTIETLKKIAAKCTLGLPLTEHEKAMWTLYGDAYTNGITPAAPERHKRLRGVCKTKVSTYQKQIWFLAAAQKIVLILKLKSNNTPTTRGLKSKSKARSNIPTARCKPFTRLGATTTLPPFLTTGGRRNEVCI